MASMLRRQAEQLLRRGLAASSAAAAAGGQGKKVAVLGAAGGIGQPLSLLMKLNPLVSQLALYDIAGTPGVNADISHVCTNSTSKGYMGAEQLGEALSGSDLVLIPAGVPRKPGMTRQDLFNINAGIVKGLVESIALHCPQAVIGMISNPVNSTVPIAAEVLKKAGCYDPTKLMGVTTLDVVRAKTFYGHAKGLDPSEVDIPVIGGHAGITIIPLFSQAKPYVELTPEEREQLTTRTQDGGTEVVQAKAGKGSATLSMAYAAAVYADKVLKGLSGEKTFEYAFVASTLTEVPFFASKVSLGVGGVEEVHSVGSVSRYEEELIAKSIPELQASIAEGIKFVQEI